ncbi:MAG: hypothetical protein WEB89_05910 [Balneolales bacterium]
MSTNRESARTVSSAQVDSLLLKELSAFNIPSHKVRWNRVDVDSNFFRKDYHVRLPGNVSRTWFHSELSKKLHDANMKTWAKVDIPEQDMKIYVLNDNTIIRSLNVETDTSYYRQIHPAVVMVYFDRAPDEQLLNQINTFDEPISLVLRVRSADQAEAWIEHLDKSRHNFYFWMTDDDYYPGADFNGSRFLQRSLSIAEVSSRPGLLFFQPVSAKPDPGFFEKFAKRNISLVQARDASIISHKDGKFEFDQVFSSFLKDAQHGRHPVTMIYASKENMEWLANGLIELKKGGIWLTRPNLVNGKE